MPVTHSFVSGKSDPVDATLIRPSNWNAPLVVRDAILAKSVNYTLGADDEIVLATGGAGGITQTFPTAVGRAGKRYLIKRVDAGAGDVNIATTSGQTIDGQPSWSLSNQWQFIEVESDNANWLIVGQN